MQSLIDRLSSAYVRLSIHDEEGQGLMEYALIISLVAIVLVVVLTLFQGNIELLFNRVRDAL